MSTDPEAARIERAERRRRIGVARLIRLHDDDGRTAHVDDALVPKCSGYDKFVVSRSETALPSVYPSLAMTRELPYRQTR